MNGSTFVWEERGEIFTGCYSDSIIPPDGAISVRDLWEMNQRTKKSYEELKKLIPAFIEICSIDLPENRNYLEWQVLHKADKGDVELIFCVSRKDRRTPHELRRDAEERAAR